MNILKLEKRGWDFLADDERAVGSDIGNYRVDTPDYIVRGKDGNDYFLEFRLAEKWKMRTRNKRTGAPLMHPVRELVSACVCGFDASYIAKDGICRANIGLEREVWENPRPYTVAGILDIVNSFAAVPYDGIEFVDR